MQTGVVKYPERAGFFLSPDQMLQILGFPRAPARRSYVPFAHTGAGIGRLPHVCRRRGCYKKVQWSMQTGVGKFPDWFSPLTNCSSFEDFQRHLHGAASFSGVCPEPGAAWAPEVQLPTRQPISGSCRTSVEGEECYKKVQWAMQTGVVKCPEWLTPLTNSSSFEDSSDTCTAQLGSPTYAPSLVQHEH